MNVLLQDFEVLYFIQNTRTVQNQVIIVGRDSFKKPQQRGVGRRAQVIRHKGRGFDAFDIPCMKILVADEAE